MPQKFESWVIIILTKIDSIFRPLVLPIKKKKPSKQKRVREAMFPTVTTKQQKKTDVLKVTPILFKQIAYKH